MLEAMDREMFPLDIIPTRSARQPFGEYTSTLAMHWDGTYRDRNAFLEDVFWAEEDYEGGQRPTPANDIAEHLTFSDTAPWNRFTDPAY